MVGRMSQTPQGWGHYPNGDVGFIYGDRKCYVGPPEPLALSIENGAMRDQGFIEDTCARVVTQRLVGLRVARAARLHRLPVAFSSATHLERLEVFCHIGNWSVLGRPSAIVSLTIGDYREPSLDRFGDSPLSLLHLFGPSCDEVGTTQEHLWIHSPRSAISFRGTAAAHVILDRCDLVSLDEIPRIDGLKTLYVHGHRGFTSLEFVSRCPSLEKLVLEKISGIRRLDFGVLVNAPRLRELVVTDLTFYPQVVRELAGTVIRVLPASVSEPTSTE